MDLVPSPDGQSIAVLTFDRQHRQNGDMQPNWLWVVDLRTNNVQSLPDYAHYDLFKWYYYGSPGRILGWLDGDRIAVQRTGGFPVIARRDGSSYDEVTFPQGGVGQVALSPDRTTFFTDAFSRDTYQYGLWLNNVDGSNARLLLDGSHIRPVDNPQWSPDGRFVSFGTPKQNTLPEGTTQVVPGYRSICLLDVTSRTLSILGNEDSWDADPQWSSDSATLAFLRAPAPVANDGEAYYGSYEKVGTHLYSVDIRDSQLRPRQVLPRAGNTSILKWMPDGGLLLASTLDAPENQPRVSVFSPGPGSLTTLVSHSPSETAVHPVYISR